MSAQQNIQEPAQPLHDPYHEWLVINFNVRNIALVLVVFGLLVSGYLSYVKLTNAPMVCPTGEGSAFNCEVVQNSIYAYMPPKSGIAIAWLGFATYVVIGGLILFEKRIPLLREWSIPITFGIVTFAFLFSMYLIYVQAVLLKAFCMWCLMHEINMTILFIVTIIRLIMFFNKPHVEEA